MTDTLPEKSGVPLLDAAAINRALARMAHEILEHNETIDSVALVGLHSRGVPLAQRLGKKLQEISSKPIPTGTLDITFFRDDLAGRHGQRVVKSTEISFDVTDKIIVLVDDVLFTGRTIRAAMDALADLGRPIKIQLAVLIDRGHRDLPIRPDYVGKNIPTSLQEKVRVRLVESDGVDDVRLER